MKAIVVRQPWATLIALGIKTIETRPLMGVRAKRGTRWPDEYGKYEIVNGDGWLLLYAMADHFGPDTEAVAERILAAINGDTVPAPTLPEDVGELVRLKSWKAEATEVIAGWERVWDAMGRPGRLGRPKSEGCLEALVAASPVPDLPSWVSMHATATGADLIEHDPNGDEWERRHGGCWSRHHADTANFDDTYLVRRRPVPVEPTTEKVPLMDAVGRTLDCPRREITAWWDEPDGVCEAVLEPDRLRRLDDTEPATVGRTISVDDLFPGDGHRYFDDERIESLRHRLVHGHDLPVGREEALELLCDLINERHPADLTYSEWVELLEAVQQELRCDDGRPGGWVPGIGSTHAGGAS